MLMHSLGYHHYENELSQTFTDTNIHHLYYIAIFPLNEQNFIFNLSSIIEA